MKRPTELEIREKIREFAKKKCNKIGLHNMYYIFSEDMDGNVTGEAYAINSYTDFGLQHVSVNGYGLIMSSYYNSGPSNYSSGTLYFGTEWPEVTPENPNAGTPLDPNFGNMYNSVFGVTSPIRSYGHAWVQSYYPTDLYTDGTFITGVGFNAYFISDYNYNNLATDVQIKELGIIPIQKSSLGLHSRVLDSEGNPSYFWKRLNEKITVYVYGAHNVPISLIKGAYDAGWNGQTWNLFNASFLFMNPQYLYYLYDMSCYYYGGRINMSSRDLPHRMNQSGSDSNTGTYTTVSDETSTNHQVKHHTYFPSRLLEGKHEYIDHLYGYHYNMATYNSYGLKFNKYIQQAAGDADILETNLLTCNNSYSTWWNDDYSLTNLFGLTYNQANNVGIFPTQYFTINQINMFNIKTNQFDIADQFSAYSDLHLNLIWDDLNKGYVYIKWPDDNYYNTAVYTNTNPQYAITHFDDTNITAMYASDEWWDVSTWQPISNLQNVDSTTGKKRYYIIKYDQSTNGLHPHWDEEPRLIPATQYKELGVSIADEGYHGFERIIANDTNHFIIGYNQIVFLDSNMDHVTTWAITGYNNTRMSARHRYYYGTKVCILCLSRDETSSNPGTPCWARIYDVSNPSADPTTSYVDIEVNTNTNVTASTYVHHRGCLMNDRPYVVFWDKILNANNKYCVQILDFSQANTADMVDEIEDATYPFLIDNSNLLLYRDATDVDHLSFKIYDVSNKTIVHTFQLSDSYFGTLTGCFAYSTDGTLNNSLIYLTVHLPNNEYATYRYEPSTQIVYVTSCYNNTSTWTNVDVYHIGTKYGGVLNSDYNTLYLYDPDNPNSNKSVTSLEQQTITLGYINDGKQLILGGSAGQYQSGYNYYYGKIKPIDIGLWLKTGETLIVTTGNSSGWFPYSGSGNNVTEFMIPYGKGMLTRKKGTASSRELIYIPIEKCIPHYANITTRTIQSYNNPIRVQGIELEDCFTNIVDRTQPVT